MPFREYKELYDAAKGDRAAYLKAAYELPNGSKNALTYWLQFERQVEVRRCVCANGGELVRFLKHLPLAHEDYKIVTASSADVDGTVVLVESNPITKTITITSAG